MLIKANNLTKRYGTKLALDNVNLQIDRGQLIAYLGTNGAGKSTTINLLTGLMTPTSGMIARRQGIITTRQTGGLHIGYKPIIKAGVSRRWLSLCSSQNALTTLPPL